MIKLIFYDTITGPIKELKGIEDLKNILISIYNKITKINNQLQLLQTNK